LNRWKSLSTSAIRVLFLILSDLLSFYLSLLFAVLTRHWVGQVFKSFFIPFKHSLGKYTFFGLVPVVFIVVLGILGFYNQRRYFLEELEEFIKALIIYFFILVTILSIARVISGYSRFVLILTPFYLLVLFPLFRWLTNNLLSVLGVKENCVFIGGPEAHKKFEREVLSDKYLNFREGEPANYVFVSTSIENFDNILKELQATHRFVLIFDDAGRFLTTKFKVFLPVGSEIPVLSFQNKLLDPKRLFIRRIIEILLALILLPFLIPLIGIIGIIIKLDSKGPIFYKQERVGKGGKPFKIFKFRTMFVDADKRLAEILSKDPEAKAEWEKYYKLKNDPRVTRVGKFLRRYSLDELPQIFNVIKGDMSFIGPRPVLQEELDKYYGESKFYYMSVKPGITGLWQVMGRNELDYETRVRLDVWYVVNWSLWLDLIILLKTIWVVFKGKGAF